MTGRATKAKQRALRARPGWSPSTPADDYGPGYWSKGETLTITESLMYPGWVRFEVASGQDVMADKFDYYTEGAELTKELQRLSSHKFKLVQGLGHFTIHTENELAARELYAIAASLRDGGQR